VFDGKIIWESESVVLTVTHKTEHDIKDDGRVGLLVVKKVIFSEKEYELKERIGKF
jgi:hypothetical protein